MYAELKENKSGHLSCVFKDEETPVVKGSKIEFLKGSDCPTGKAKCTKIELTGILTFKNIEEDNNVESFKIHIKDFSEEEVKTGYSQVE